MEWNLEKVLKSLAGQQNHLDEVHKNINEMPRYASEMQEKPSRVENGTSQSYLRQLHKIQRWLL